MRVNFWHPISFPVSIDKSNNIFLCLQNPQAGFKFEVSDPGIDPTLQQHCFYASLRG